MYAFIKNNWIICVGNSYSVINDNVVVRVENGRVNIGKNADITVDEHISIPEDWKYMNRDFKIVDMNYLIELTEIEIDKLIQNEIDTYNRENGTKFRTIDSMTKYERDNTYKHYPFAVSVLDWNKSVWEKSRQLQSDIEKGVIDRPATIADFIDMLPKRI